MDNSVSDCWEQFKDFLFSLVDRFIPFKESRSIKKAHKLMWMTNKALRLVQQKRKLFSKYKKSYHTAMKSGCRAAKAKICKARKIFRKKLQKILKWIKKVLFHLRT